MVLQSWQISFISLFTPPPFSWVQYFPIPFNCRLVPFLHVTVSDGLKAMGKQKGRISSRWCGWTSSKHNLYWGKFAHHENLLFILCECIFAENKWCISIHQLFINVWKLSSIDFSSTELQNKHQLTVCPSWVQPTLWFVAQRTVRLPEYHSFPPYTACTSVFIGSFVCGLIHHAANVTVWKSSLVCVDA